MIDRFSKLVSLTPIVSQNENTIIGVIKEQWIYKFGRPRAFLSDRGKVFESNKMKEFAVKFGIKQEFTSPYQHQSNGLAERTIRTVRDMLVTTMKSMESNKCWSSWIPQIEFSINATYQSSTGRSPFEIIYGRKIQLHGLHQNTDINREEIVEDTKNHLKQAAEVLKKLDSDKRGSRIFFVGEKVLVKIDPQKIRKDGFRYEGPYEILEFLSPHQVLLQYPDKAKPRRIEWLKRVSNMKRGGS